MSDAGVWLRLLAAFGALALGAAAVVIVVVLAHRTPGPVASAAGPPEATPPTTAAKEPAFPAPPKGAVVFSRQDGSDVLALAVVPGRTLGLQASVVGQGGGVNGLRVSFRVGTRVTEAETCGAGCYRATSSPGDAPTTVVVNVRRADRTTSWVVRMPRPWPPRDASALVARAARTFGTLRTLVTRDHLASDAQHALLTHWKLVAPDRLSYQVVGGPAGIIIGKRRWDKLPGEEWKEAAQAPIRQPAPFWTASTDAHVLESTKHAWRLSFFDPKSPAWYELLVDKRSLRTLDLKMNTTAHFMHEIYGPFNAPLRIKPPQ